MGRVHSFQSLGTVDGPGIRAVVFVQGCPLRCVCCHNPDTWDFAGGEETSAAELFAKIIRLKNYFGEQGGVTVSGGEPLMQAEFVTELFTLCKNAGINTALDTSGCVLDDTVKRLLDVTDLVILDYKYANDADYRKYTGCEKKRIDEFLSYLDSVHLRTWIRRVIIKGLSDGEESARELFSLPGKYKCIEKTELLPFRKLCIEKYKALGIKFPLEDTPETDEETLDRLYKQKP